MVSITLSLMCRSSDWCWPTPTTLLKLTLAEDTHLSGYPGHLGPRADHRSGIRDACWALGGYRWVDGQRGMWAD